MPTHDTILVHNHFGRSLGRNYKEKAELLGSINVPGLNLLRKLVIDPRNDIEHAYAAATEEQARHACEIAELFLMATEKEASTLSVVALGWNVSYRHDRCTLPGMDYEKREFSLEHFHRPMLLIDEFALSKEVFVLQPKDETLLTCLRDDFNPVRCWN